MKINQIEIYVLRIEKGTYFQARSIATPFISLCFFFLLHSRIKFMCFFRCLLTRAHNIVLCDWDARFKSRIESMRYVTSSEDVPQEIPDKNRCISFH